ncbi:MAG: czcC 1 [Pedosphaera sp.]|nr:czcC 1 [Pedosphaera sp.]
MMTKFKVVSLLVLPLVAAGCRTNPTLGFDDVQRTVGSRAGQSIEWPRTRAENDKVEAAVSQVLQQPLAAEKAVQVAFLNNRSLRATLEEIGISRAELVQAGLLRNPDFGASFRFPDRPPSAAKTEFSLAGDVLDLLLLPLKKKVASLQFEQTKLRVSHDILQLAAEVKTAFYTVQARQQLLKRVQAIVEVNEAGVDLSTRQHKAGNITDLALANQQASFQQARLEWGKTQTQLRVDREHLNRLLGLWGTNTQWRVEDELPPIPNQEIPFEKLESFAIQQRLDLAAAQQQVALVGRALSLRTNTRYLPAAITLGVDTEQEPDRQRVTGPILNLELPIFDRGQGAIARLQAQYRQAQWQLEALATNVRADVRQARDTMIATRDLTEFYGKIYLPQRIRIVNETLLQYNAMQIGTFELIAAKERELSTEREYVEAWRDYWIARAELEKALGGKLPGETKPASPTTPSAPPDKSQDSEHQQHHQP